MSLNDAKKAYVGNAGDEEQVKEAKQKESRNRHREEEDTRWVLSTPQGRRFYWRFLIACEVYKSTFTGDRWGDFKEGKRSIGLKLLADLEAARPAAYLEMLSEQQKENENG